MTPVSAYREHAIYTPMYPQVSPPQDTRRYRTPERDDEVMLSGRKKPVCQACGLPMAGHKRPNGVVVCPRDSASASPSPSPSPSPRAYRSPKTRAPPETPVHYETPEPPPRSLLSRISPKDVRAEPTASGYWHKQNPNWETPEHYARLPRAPTGWIPQRNATPGGSWQSTEPNESAGGTPPPHHHYVEDDEEEQDEQDEEDDGEDTETARSVSPAPSNQFTRFTRHMTSMLSRSTPVATEYSAPADEILAIEYAAKKEGLHTRVVRRSLVKPEPESPNARLSPGAQGVARESSWRIFVGRDPSIVNTRAESHLAHHDADRATPQREVLDLSTPEPYDFDRGLNKERNELVGTYPVDPRLIRQNFCDVIIAAVVSAFFVVFFLSKA
ncbi:hypothetical protein FKP32DRAFT_1591059 [Trametes sanguinea]|nr:hypothetical protein FKP32DRAFT_1591059 [Trametes sanguinea]